MNKRLAKRPGWPVLTSLLIHGLAFTASLFIPPFQRQKEEYVPWPRIVRNESSPARMVVFLPAIGGGQQGQGGKGKSSPRETPPTDSGKKGRSFPGPQRIRSDSSSPTSRSQTLLQPGREDLPVLDEPVELPNIVSIKDPGPDLQPQVPDAETDFVAPARFVKPVEEKGASESDGDTIEPPPASPLDLPSVAKPAPELPKPIRLKTDQLTLQPALTAMLPEPLKKRPESPPENEQETRRPEAEEVTAVKPPRDLPKPVAIQPAEAALPPGLPEPAEGPPDSPEQQQPAKPSDQAATEELQLKVEDLPVQQVTEVPPQADSTEEAVDSDLPKAATESATRDEPKQTMAQKLGGSLDRPIQSVAQPAPTLSDAPRKVAPTSLPLPSTELGNLLALTPAPKPITDPIEVPEAQARGQFEISPQANPEGSEAEPGSSSGRADQFSNSAGEVSGAPPSVVTISFGSEDGAGSGGGQGSGNGEGSGSGTGQGSGPQAGSGIGTGIGPGTGAGSGPGTGPFAGITVVGGVGGEEASSSTEPFSGISVVGGVPGPGAASSDQPFAGITTVGGIGDSEAAPDPLPDGPTPRPVETKYGVVVLSTQDSGGGLPNVGAFSNERIHTVYLDMRQQETDQDPVWTVEFAEPWESGSQRTAVRMTEESQSDFVKPSPAVKEKPELPQDLVQKHLGSMILVYALIDAEGRFEQLSVKESPDPLFDQPVLEALSKWVFRPAALNGKPVAVKALLGIPIG